MEGWKVKEGKVKSDKVEGISDFPSENQHSALILTAGRFTSVGEEREAILEICMQVLLSECKTRSLVERVRIVNLHYLFPASVPK